MSILSNTAAIPGMIEIYRNGDRYWLGTDKGENGCRKEQNRVKEMVGRTGGRTVGPAGRDAATQISCDERVLSDSELCFSKGAGHAREKGLMEESEVNKTENMVGTGKNRPGHFVLNFAALIQIRIGTTTRTTTITTTTTTTTTTTQQQQQQQQ